MKDQRARELPAELKQIRSALESWRAKKGKGRRIPEQLWTRAAGAVRGHGLNRVSRALGLNYYDLKKRTEEIGEQKKDREESRPVFVELGGCDTEATERDRVCTIELEKSCGVRMRIHVGDAATVDWSRIKEAFLGA